MTRSKGFTLIELLVVVAILGIISAIGIVSYNGYIGSTKKKTAENIIQQISLVQAEHKNEYEKALSCFRNIVFTKRRCLAKKEDL